jgi:hypothetical protein
LNKHREFTGFSALSQLRIDAYSQHSIADHLVALKIGKQTRYGLSGNTLKSEDFF